MFNRYQIQALLVFTGVFGALAWEGVKWVAGLFG
jgi:hypothetical protein